MRAEGGFTVLEMLVALAIFSMAVLALVNLTGENARTSGALEERFFASVIAENRAVEVLTAAQSPPLGESNGSEEAGSRLWHWTETVTETAEPGMLRIDIAVRGPGTDQVLSEISLFRVLR
jgi:general secretion pathway protein I